MLKTLVLLLVLSTLSIGCKTLVLHPVTDKDIRMDGNWVCMTPEYIQEVMRAKLEAK